MTDDELSAALTEIFRDLFGDDELTLRPDMTADDVAGWDSIKHISLIVAIEDRFGVKFRTSELDELKTVGDLVGQVLAKTAGRNG